jgi:hypothetical protein
MGRDDGASMHAGVSIRRHSERGDGYEEPFGLHPDVRDAQAQMAGRMAVSRVKTGAVWTGEAGRQHGAARRMDSNAWVLRKRYKITG